MKRLLVCLLLLGVAGCGFSEHERQVMSELKENGAKLEGVLSGEVATITLEGQNFTNEVFLEIKKLDGLKKLVLVDTSINNEGLAELKQFPHLEHVRLQGNRLINSVGIDFVKELGVDLIAF